MCRPGQYRPPKPLEPIMGTTRTEQAINDIDTLGDEPESCCDDVRLVWLARELNAASAGSSDFDALWADR